MIPVVESVSRVLKKEVFCGRFRFEDPLTRIDLFVFLSFYASEREGENFSECEGKK